MLKMQNVRLAKYLVLFLFSFLFVTQVNARQLTNEFQLASRLFQQQNYSEALPLLQEVFRENPSEPIYFDRLIECYIQLKQYDEALKEIENLPRSFPNKADAEVLKGKLYHLNSETDKAFEVWNENIEKYQGQFQLYVTTAQAMNDVRAYDNAIEVYNKARTLFNNQDIFILDIANTYMLASNYEGAIKEWLNLVERRPEQISSIQSTLLRYNDRILYDIAILDIDDRLNEMNSTNPAYTGLFQLQIWLLQENKLFRRALVSARTFESSTQNYNYSLFNLGRQLAENKEYELAIQAFEYYNEKAAGEVKWRSMNELSGVYSLWAKNLDSYNIDFKNERDSLIQLSFDVIEALENEGRNYSRFPRVLLQKAEIALDFLYKPEIAEESIASLKIISDENESPEIHYLEGRVHLYKNEFTRARIAFTKANKIAKIGELAEKTRYFLALTDFYSEDYEFATIQLRTLGRQNTSFYANDALQLRLWLQKGLGKDSVSTVLPPFANAQLLIETGEIEKGLDLLSNQLSESQNNPLFEDILILLSSNTDKDPLIVLTLLSEYISKKNPSPLRERLLWEEAKWNEILYPTKDFPSKQNPRDLYEQLIIEYPDGFYAPEARRRLAQFSNMNS